MSLRSLADISALHGCPLKANMFSIEIDVGFVPEADFLWGNHRQQAGDNLARSQGKTFKLPGTFELAPSHCEIKPIIPGSRHGSDCGKKLAGCRTSRQHSWRPFSASARDHVEWLNVHHGKYGASLCAKRHVQRTCRCAPRATMKRCFVQWPHRTNDGHCKG
jgi:hypothetical protein